MPTIAEQKASQRTRCDDMIEIQTDGSILQAAHLWPGEQSDGCSCLCGEWQLSISRSGTMIVKGIPTKKEKED